jgi:enoyl-CoA hydratase/carnithine racemase
MAAFEEYSQKYESVQMERRDGILQLTLHTNGDTVVWGPIPHTELPDAFADVGNDPENLCVIFTGAGDAFIPGKDWETPREKPLTNEDWYHVVKAGTRLVMNLVNIDAPVIAAVNGPCSVHSELAVVCDIVLASPNTVFQDSPHFWNGLVPGDGMSQIWQYVLGPNRGRYFLLTGQQLDAQEAFDFGVVNEIVPSHELLDRAWELAREIVKRSPLALRYTKLLMMAEFRRLLMDQLPYGLVLEGAAHIDQGGLGLGLTRRTTGIDGTGFARKRDTPTQPPASS